MKNKLGIILSLLLILTLDGLVLAGETKSVGAAFSPDGVAVAHPQRRRKRRRRYRAQRPTSYPVVMTPGAGEAPPEKTAVPEQPAPPPPPPEPAQEMPNASAPPPPPAADPMDAPGQGRPSKKAGPRIKPPTVNIKPPTR